MRIVMMSDTHNQHRKLVVPDGDVLVHAGDFTMGGTMREIVAFGAWMRELPHKHKVVIAGNHDLMFEREPALARMLLGDGLIYLEESGATVEGLRFWGSPWQPRFFDWAFNANRGHELRARWAKIEASVDVLITHGPPHKILDFVPVASNEGCEELAAAVLRVRPKLHVFGHIHEGAGRVEQDGVVYVNASALDGKYYPLSSPIQTIDL